MVFGGPQPSTEGEDVMDFVNYPVALLAQAEIRVLTNAEIGIWARLQAYCTQQENSGVIRGASQWSDRQWLMAGFDMEDAPEEPTLWYFEGNDLHVLHYQQNIEDRVRTRRENGKKGGRPRKEKPPENPTKTEEKPSENLEKTDEKPKRKRKVREGKVKESKEKEGNAPQKREECLEFVQEELKKQRRSTAEIVCLSELYGTWFDYRSTTKVGDKKKIQPLTKYAVTQDMKRLGGLLGKSKKYVPPRPLMSFDEVDEKMGEAMEKCWQGWLFEEPGEVSTGTAISEKKSPYFTAADRTKEITGDPFG